MYYLCIHGFVCKIINIIIMIIIKVNKLTKYIINYKYSDNHNNNKKMLFIPRPVNTALLYLSHKILYIYIYIFF